MGSSTQVITPRHSILLRCSLTFGCKAMGHFLGICIMGWTLCWSWILYLPGSLPIPVNWSGNSFINVISGPDGLGCCLNCSRLGCGCCCGSRCRTWGLVPGCMTVTAQFIFMIASLSHDRRPRMAGLGVSATYNMNWSCKGWTPDHLAARQWGHGVHHIGVYGICYRWWVWCWHDPGQWAGQLGWSGLGGDVKKHRGAACYLQLQCQPWTGWGCSFTGCLQAVLPWCVLHCTMGHRCHLSLPLRDGCLLQFHSQLYQQTAHHTRVFLGADLYYVGSSLFLPLVMGGLHSSFRLSGVFACSTRAVHFTSQWPFWNSHCRWCSCRIVTARGVWAGTVGALWGTLL